MRPYLLLSLLTIGCAAVPPRLDPTTLGAVAPEEKFVVTTATDSAVTVDHLRIDTDSLHARKVPIVATDAGADFSVPRSSVTELRRSYTGGVGIELVFVPIIALLAGMAWFVHSMGGSGS